MKKNIVIISIVIISSFLLTLFILNRESIYKKLEEKANIIIENMKDAKQIKKYQKEGFVVLKDLSVWRLLSEDDTTVTLISAYPLSSEGKIDKEDPFLMSYNESCLEDCNVIEKESDLNSFIAKKFLEPLINKFKVEKSNTFITRLATLEDLKSLGCDIDNLTCKDAPSWLVEYPFWTSATIAETNEVFIVDNDKTIKSYNANEKAYVRVVIQIDKKNIY